MTATWMGRTIQTRYGMDEELNVVIIVEERPQDLDVIDEENAAGREYFVLPEPQDDEV